MRSALPVRLPNARSGPLAVLASNLVVPVGVIVLGWSTTVLLGVFDTETVEIGGTDDDPNANRSLRVAHVADPTPIAEALDATWYLER